MTQPDIDPEWLPLYRAYHKNQQNLIDASKIDKSTRSPDWSTGEYKEYDRGQSVSAPSSFNDLLDDEVLSALRHRRSFDTGNERKPIPKRDLFTILWCAYGIDQETDTRPVPSPGQLYPLELYPVVLRSPDINSGLYHYNPGENRLERPVDPGYVSERFGPLAEFVTENWDHIQTDQDISSMILVTGVIPRTARKYGERGYMFALIEVGALIQSVQLAAARLDIGSRAYAGFRYDRVSDMLGLTDHEQEWVLTSIALAHPDSD